MGIFFLSLLSSLMIAVMFVAYSFSFVKEGEEKKSVEAFELLKSPAGSKQ